jgi:hypothetical protein
MVNKISDLPTDVQLHILSYTYAIQPTSLLRDIKSFVEDGKKVLEFYNNLPIFLQELAYGENLNFLLNDLYRYCNDFIATRHGFNERFHDIFKRNFLISRMECNVIDWYIDTVLMNKNVSSQIIMFWGLLTYEERNDFLQTFRQVY